MESAAEEAGSLFEGMVLFSPSDLSPPPPPSPPSPAAAPPPVVEEPRTSTVSKPLDEDLFSDLTLLPATTAPADDPTPPATITSLPPPSRQISRKKKRAVRIGYARDDDPLPSTSPVDDQPPRFVDAGSSPPLSPSIHSSEVREEELPRPASAEKPDGLVSIEEKLELIRAQISHKLDQVRKMAESASADRKEAGRRRREAAESLNSVLEKYKELEKELEEACEAEDFDKAESLSESLATAEKDKDRLLTGLKHAEGGCDLVDAKMQEVLELQIAAEEEGVHLLEQFAKDAADTADLIFKQAEEISVERIKDWQSSMEILETERTEADVESCVINEARLELEHSIEHLVEDDRKEKEILRSKQVVLAKELDELLAMVRKKEEEIAENNSKIQEVERRISNVVSEFCGTQSNIDTKYNVLQLAISRIDSEIGSLSTNRKEIDESVFVAEQKRSKLKELSSVSADEARICQDSVQLRKNLATCILKSREDRTRLAKTEENILEDIQTLREQNSAARASLQALSSNRATIQQEVASIKQRISFIDKRGPELEAEKKVAAAARNFKEAGRIAAEAKELSQEKENLMDRRDKAISGLEKLEEEIRETVDKMQENEGLITCKEKEAAIAGCQRLRLIAAATRAERSAAIELGDLEESDVLLQEADAAETKARKLEEAYGLATEEHEPFDNCVSIVLITNLTGQRLAEVASSFNLSASNETQ